MLAGIPYCLDSLMLGIADMPMKQVIEQIKQAIAECKKNSNMFKIPSFCREDVKITNTDTGSHGSALYRKEFNIEFDNGDWIYIEYESKDKMRTFQVNPDRSVIRVTCNDPSLDFSDAWDKSMYGR